MITTLTDANTPLPCAQVDPDLFFPGKGGSTRIARWLCSRCPVREACLQFALDHGVGDGIWGGTSRVDRERIRSGLRAAA